MTLPELLVSVSVLPIAAFVNAIGLPPIFSWSSPSSSYSIDASWSLPKFIFLSSAIYTSPNYALVVPMSAPPTASGMIDVFAVKVFTVKVPI